MKQKDYTVFFNDNLEKWLEGHDGIDEKWIKKVIEMKEKGSRYLFRTIVSSENYELLEKVNIPVRELFSASDTVLSSFYASCSYNRDININKLEDNQKLYTIRFKVERCCISLHTLRSCVFWRYSLLYGNKVSEKLNKDSLVLLDRINAEREYICHHESGYIKGQIVLKTDNINIIKNSEYKKYEIDDSFSISPTILMRDDVKCSEFVKMLY